jgi:hypothetical protein
MFGGGVRVNITNDVSFRGQFRRFFVKNEEADMLPTSLLY